MKTVFLKLLVVVLVCLYTHGICQQLSLIPEPVQLKRNNGSFVLSGSSVISIPANQAALGKIAGYFNEKIKLATGFSLKTIEGGKGTIEFALNSKADPVTGREGYTLEVTTDQITVRANDPAGVFYAVQTLLQLLPKEVEKAAAAKDVQWQIPSVSIVDYPRFQWRGIMLDVSRNFFTKEYVKEYIDQIARYKFNIFHWHLTDDNGWRIEIKSLPRLTAVGAWRVPRTGTFGSNDAPKPGEKATVGGFYTQADIKEIIQYARDRYVQILPEVDVPGHSMAALAAYPEMSVSKDTSTKVNPGSNFATWHGDGKFEMHIDNTLNPTDENVYKFLDKIFTEIAAIFPFEYIHIGGDECYKGFWEKDPAVQAFMKKNNIRTGEELQSYFTRRLTKMIMDKKKKVIGWDEILEGGLASGAAVMSWRGTKGGIEAAHQKHQVVMSPAPMYYLDMGQGEPSIEPPIYSTARLKETYSHEVIPPGVDSVYILGGQGNLWTEQIPTEAQVEYMTYPRAFALSESLWSPKSKKNWNSFVEKVEEHFARLDNAGINFAPSMYDPIINVRKVKGSNELTVEMSSEVPGVSIHYTFDNTIPNKYSPVYENKALTLPEGADSFRVISLRDGKPAGRLITLKTEELQKRAK
jgi:hexosaminidase